MGEADDDTPDRARTGAAGSGVDVTLIDAMLALDPTERLRQNDRALAMLEALRRGLGTDEPPR